MGYTITILWPLFKPICPSTGRGHHRFWGPGTCCVPAVCRKSRTDCPISISRSRLHFCVQSNSSCCAGAFSINTLHNAKSHKSPGNGAWLPAPSPLPCRAGSRTRGTSEAPSAIPNSRLKTCCQRHGCKSKICTQNGILAKGNMDQHLRSPGGLILTPAHVFRSMKLAIRTLRSSDVVVRRNGRPVAFSNRQECRI